MKEKIELMLHDDIEKVVKNFDIKNVVKKLGKTDGIEKVFNEVTKSKISYLKRFLRETEGEKKKKERQELKEKMRQIIFSDSRGILIRFNLDYVTKNLGIMNNLFKRDFIEEVFHELEEDYRQETKLNCQLKLNQGGWK